MLDVVLSESSVSLVTLELEDLTGFPSLVRRSERPAFDVFSAATWVIDGGVAAPNGFLAEVGLNVFCTAN